MRDVGTFQIYWNEERIGVIEFTRAFDGGYRGRSTVAAAGQRVTYTVDVEADGAGGWRPGVLGAPIGAATIQRHGRRARLTSPEASITVAVARDAVLYDWLSPALMADVLRRYDGRFAGQRTIPVFSTLGVSRTAVIEADGPGSREAVEGEALERFRVTLAGLRLLVVRCRGTIGHVEVPAYHVAFVRVGYEDLRPDSLARSAEWMPECD